MSAPPLIRPPSKPGSRMKFPGLKIPQSHSMTSVIGPADDDIDMTDATGRSITTGSLHSLQTNSTDSLGSYGRRYGDSSLMVPHSDGLMSITGDQNRSPSSAVSTGLFSAEILAAVRVTDDSGNRNFNVSSSSVSEIDGGGIIISNSESSSSGYSTPAQLNRNADGAPVSGMDDSGTLVNNSATHGSGHGIEDTINSTSLSPPDVADLDEEGWATVARQGEIVDLGRLGEGAGGSVTRCRLKYGKTIFALKEITTNPNPELQKQILRELQFNRSCNSPHIVKYYGTFLSNEFASIFIAMEYCGGGSLEAIYKRVKARGGRIGEKVLGKIAEGVLSGLSYLHERRIIHRDIKPQNILLDSQGQVKLCDFGVSGEVVNSLATTFTGTSYYMAPERIQGQPYTVTSDVWSLGLTLMEVAQHRFPFLPEGHDPLMPIELLTFIVNMPAPELQDEPEEGIKWSDTFRHFLSCCLEKDPKKRASPRQMLNHPWMIGQRPKNVKMDKFVRECWS